MFDFSGGIDIRQSNYSDEILSIIVTFLVALNIWSTIASRDEVKEAKEVADNLHRMEARLNNFNRIAEGHLL